MPRLKTLWGRARRDARCVEMRRMGYSFRAIAEAARCCPATVRRAVLDAEARERRGDVDDERGDDSGA